MKSARMAIEIEQHIAAGSDLDVKVAYGSTPLLEAATFRAAEAADMLSS